MCATSKATPAEYDLATSEPSVFSVVPAGDRWGICAEGRVLMLTSNREDAEALVAAAKEVLAREADWRRRVPGEPRSFKDPS
jgi:uncharacterized protein YaiE (UPF0345 family)